MTPTTPDTPSAPDPSTSPNAFAPPRPAARQFSAPAASGGAGLRILLFALIVLVPVVALGYVYWDFQRSGGIKELPDGYKLVDLKAMSTFEFDQENGTIDQVPEIYRNLDGQKVVLEGEMYTTTSAAGHVREFDLVYSIANCCYGGAPKVQHFIKSRAADGGTLKFYRAPVRARGTLHVDVKKADGKVQSIYEFDVESVEPIG